MNYDNFKQQILSGLQERLPNASLSIEPVLKNNAVSLDGLIILENETNISPTLYLNYYYDIYCDGTTFPDILDSILNTYYNTRPCGKINTAFYTNYQNVRDKIAYKLVNYEANKSLLSGIPHYRKFDLAIVFYCLLTTSITGNATILIRNEHLHFWNISKHQLFLQAKENTEKLLPYQLKNMNELLSEMLKSENPQLEAGHMDEPSICPMYVLTNQSKLYGASCVLYEHLLEDIAKQFDSDFYILPSSIHEVILIPASDNTSYSELSQMVQDVNETQVSPEELLSDHVYYFSRSQNVVLF
ncbi:MAG: DUF5688 family protein [Roseburia sp.]